MASITSVTMTDDLDGSKAAETVAFALDGAIYEIDLSKRNAAALRKALASYVTAGRRLPRTAKARRTVADKTSAERAEHRAYLSKVRTWAAANEMGVSDRGRLPKSVLEAYDAAQA
ncbi:Lsr2 family protein [Nakamurella sp. YIM 132087]|uniref:Lsr2 family protein n=1 Tax=Nakamurella alba TaxID=2665158 RepID=A0A7K1FTL1_9ACTN|nr:Lsr2 family protein [Nakamurella alba]MTD17506.1 Lsr2 family protein [Nakamurella alba]